MFMAQGQGWCREGMRHTRGLSQIGFADGIKVQVWLLCDRRSLG